MAQDFQAFPATILAHLKFIQLGPWPGLPEPSNSFLPLPYDPVRNFSLHPGLLDLLFVILGLVLTLLFFDPVEQFWGHTLLEALL